MTGRVRPGRPYSPLFVAVFIVGVWWLVAHGSGDGWVQTVGDAVFATLLIGVLGPAWFLARSRVTVVTSPADTTTGLAVEVTLAATSRVRVGPIFPPGSPSLVGPTRRSRRPGPRPAAHQTITLVPIHRGVYETLLVEVASAAPFGLQWWTRRLTLSLSTPLHVAPRKGDPMFRRLDEADASGDGGRFITASAGLTRGVRDYRPGDLRTHIHWPATAHTRELMVKDMETPAAEPITVTVRLPADAEAAERVAERAMGTIAELFDADFEVILATTEGTGGRIGPVADRAAAGRRLARAVPSPDTRQPDVEVV